MNEQWNKITGQFDAQPVRMRLLYTLVSIMLLALILDSLWIAGNFQKAEQLKSEITQVNETINELINAQNELNINVINQRNHPMLKQLNQVNLQIEKVKSELHDKTINLISPESMSGVLNDIILRSKKLKLVSLTKQPPQPLFDPKDKEQKIQMYRHLVELQLVGQYQDTQDFLSKLEKMPQKVSFESFEYEVDKYPQSKVKLVVSTLSLDRKWIGG